MRGRWRVASMAGMLLAAALTLPSAGPANSAGLTPAAPGTRAMWLWSNPPASEVVEWSAVRGLTEIFVSVGAGVATDGSLPGLRELKRQADRNGIGVTALGGDPSWTTNHSAALAWASAVTRTGLFAGLHVDVEPYLLPAWKTDQNGTAKSYLALLDALRAGSGLPLEADVPFWLGQFSVGGKNLATEALRRVTAVTVMSYRDSATGADSIVDVSADWLARGAAAGKRVRLGAETGALDDCTYCTFAEEGATRLGSELAKVDAATRSATAFAGIAVHHYDIWRALPA